MYVIEVRRVAENATFLVTGKGNKVMKFASEKDARKFGIEKIEKARYIASWQAIGEQEAKIRGHKI